MVYERDEPQANYSWLWSGRESMFPEREKDIVQKVFSNALIGNDAIGQRIEGAAVALVKRFHSPRCSTIYGIEQIFVAGLVGGLRNSCGWRLFLRVIPS